MRSVRLYFCMKKTAFLILLILAALVACGKEDERVLARVGEETIRVKDFLAVYVPKLYPTEEAELEAKQRILDKMVDDKLMISEARSRGFAEDSSIKAVIEDVKKEAMINALYTREVVDKSKASRMEIKKFYDADQELLELRVIHTDSDTLASMVLSDLAKGVPFDTLAARYSSDPSSRNGGNIGTIPLSNFFARDPFDQLAKLKDGQATKPIKSQIGGYDIFYLVKRTKKENPEPLTKEQEPLIKQRVEMLKQSKLSQESLERLLKESNIEYNSTGLALLSKPQDSLTDKELNIWTIKVDGKVIDSIGSMLGLYSQFPEGVPQEYIQRIAERRAQFPALIHAAERRHLDKEKSVSEAVSGFVDSKMIERLYKEEVTNKVSVTEEETKAYYDSHPDEFQVPERRNISIIRTSSYSDIQQAYAFLSQGKTFDEVAAKYSDHQSASRGGAIGFRAANDVSFRPFTEQAFKIPKGQYSRPFEVYNGFGIVKVLDIQPSSVRKYEEEKQRLERKLRGEKESERKTEFLNELRGKITVTQDKKLLMSIGKIKEEPKSQKNRVQG